MHPSMYYLLFLLLISYISSALAGHYISFVLSCSHLIFYFFDILFRSFLLRRGLSVTELTKRAIDLHYL